MQDENKKDKRIVADLEIMEDGFEFASNIETAI